MRTPKSDFHNLKDSGRACIGCGRTSDQVMLMRLRSYSRSLCCGWCFLEYATCEGVNPLGVKCHHGPIDHYEKVGACSIAGCGCARWVHGLESEADRMLADCVGKSPTFRECQGYGQNLGKCGRIILAGPDGIIPRLCGDCEKRWAQEAAEGARAQKELLELDTSEKLPN